MQASEPDNHGAPFLGFVDLDGRRFEATCPITWDGVEYVGRIVFSEIATNAPPIPDRGTYPGRDREEVLRSTQRFTPEELAQRLHRALVEKREFHELRNVTQDILAKIRYMNQVALSMHAGLLDAEGANGEIELTEKQIHELVSQLRKHAGIVA
jgi:hypothetical protein